MNRQRNADVPSVRKSNPIDFLNGNQKAISAFDFNRKQPFGQCVRCRSDYMKFAVDGYCQDCQQKVEFILREHQQVLKKIQNQGGQSNEF